MFPCVVWVWYLNRRNGGQSGHVAPAEQQRRTMHTLRMARADDAGAGVDEEPLW